MPRLPHGQVFTPNAIQESLTAPGADAFFVAPADLHDFDYMFPTLQTDPDNLLPESTQTTERLKALALTMEDLDGPGNDAPIPAAYTYFGQFVDHDSTLEVQPGELPPTLSGTLSTLVADDMAPLPLREIRNAIRNFRNGTLDLDSLYGPPELPRDPDNGAKMLIGNVAKHPRGPQPPFARPPGKTDDNDVPREPRSGDISHDRAALIGDPRNDENTIISQLHVAFLKAHNRLVDDDRTFEETRRILRQHYQHIVVHDFLKRVTDPGIVDEILEQGNRWFDATAEPFFVPLEFATAGYRFGHTMVRAGYNFNINFGGDRPGGPATLELLFTFTALSGQLGDTDAVKFETLPENWIIEWENIIGDDPGVTKARRFDTQLAAVNSKALFSLRALDGKPEQPLPFAAVLSARNLLRGYRLRMPTGQAVAGLLGLPVLKPDELRAAAANPAQEEALQDGEFLDRTPLWFYLLAEAKHHGGERLGPVGSTLVAEVLIGLVRRSEDSILSTPDWTPSLPAAQPGRFELADLLRFAGVLPGGAPTQT